MPKKKGWRKSVSRKTDWRSRKTGKYDIESPERMPAQSPEMKQAISLELMPAQSPEMKQATSLERMPALNMLNIEKPVQSNKLDKLAQKEKMHSKHEKFQSSDFIENNSNISQAKGQIMILNLLLQVEDQANRQILIQCFWILFLVLLPTIN